MNQSRQEGGVHGVDFFLFSPAQSMHVVRKIVWRIEKQVPGVNLSFTLFSLFVSGKKHPPLDIFLNSFVIVKSKISWTNMSTMYLTKLQYEKPTRVTTLNALMDCKGKHYFHSNQLWWYLIMDLHSACFIAQWWFYYCMISGFIGVFHVNNSIKHH